MVVKKIFVKRMKYRIRIKLFNFSVENYLENELEKVRRLVKGRDLQLKLSSNMTMNYSLLYAFSAMTTSYAIIVYQMNH